MPTMYVFKRSSNLYPNIYNCGDMARGRILGMRCLQMFVVHVQVLLLTYVDSIVDYWRAVNTAVQIRKLVEHC